MEDIQKIQGHLNGQELNIAIVTASFNSFITSKLEDGAIHTLIQHGVSKENITTVSVPGAYELGLICKKLSETKQYDAIIALGCVIRGATTHYDYVCNEASKGIHHASLETGIPNIFGVITTETIEQAIERAGTKAGNKGSDAAVAAIEMANLVKTIKQ